MLLWLKNALNWIKLNYKWLLLGAISVLFTILVIGWGRKNKKIRELQEQLAILKTKLQLERLTAKHDMLKEKLESLREQDETLTEELEDITFLSEELSETMTAEEISNKFNELGL